MNAREFKAGDRVWLARVGIVKATVPCPLCFRKLVVGVVQGDGVTVEVPCPYCKEGWDGPSGTTTEYQFRSEPQHLIVDEVRADESATAFGTERKIRYIVGALWADPEDVFASEAECVARCAVKVEADALADEERARHKSKASKRDAAWAAGYHRREAAKLHAEAERHEARARVLTERAKGQP